MHIYPLRWVIAGLAFTLPTAALAIPIEYRANLTALNDSGVSGTATLVLRQDDNELDVSLSATGLEPNQRHPQHIHGLFDGAGEAVESTSPTPAQDSDGDGFVELQEGAVTYGPVIVPLDPFQTAPDGTISFTQTYDLSGVGPPTYADDFSLDDLVPLFLREIVLHGAFAPPGDGTGIGGQTSATGEEVYIAALPVASGEIFRVSAVPEPATLWLLLIGFAAAALGLRRRSPGFRA